MRLWSAFGIGFFFTAGWAAAQDVDGASTAEPPNNRTLYLSEEIPEEVIFAPSQALSIVISGGISRGDYQGGQLWALVRYLEIAKRYGLMGRDSAFHPEEVVITGSSAGGINTLITALTLRAGSESICLQEGGSDCGQPESSLFFRAWVPMGLSNREDSLDFHPWAYRSDRGQELWNLLTAEQRISLRWDEIPGIADEVRPMGQVFGEEAEALRSYYHHENSVISHENFRALLRVLYAQYGSVEGGDGSFDAVRMGITTARARADSDENGMTREVNESFAFVMDAEGIRPLTLACPSLSPGVGVRDHCDAEEMVLMDGGRRSVEAPEGEEGPLRLREAPWSEGGSYDPTQSPADDGTNLFDMGWYVMPTSGIPIAFPLKTSSCEEYLATSLRPKHTCHASDVRAKEDIVWIDGGTFDGNPVGCGSPGAQA